MAGQSGSARGTPGTAAAAARADIQGWLIYGAGETVPLLWVCRPGSLPAHLLHHQPQDARRRSHRSCGRGFQDGGEGYDELSHAGGRVGVDADFGPAVAFTDPTVDALLFATTGRHHGVIKNHSMGFMSRSNGFDLHRLSPANGDHYERAKKRTPPGALR